MKVVGVLIAVVVFFVGGYVVLRRNETAQSSPGTQLAAGSGAQEKETLVVDGVIYSPRNRLATILLLGIDRDTTEPSGHVSFQNGGQADFLRLIVIDEDRKLITQIPIDRDTMTPITVLSVLGQDVGSHTTQICVSHSYGDGRELSCQLAEKAVSTLLQGVKIDYYFSLNMDGIASLNDWAGGVTVTLEDDFSGEDLSMTLGSTIRLQGSQAETFVRGRRGIGDSMNSSRMRRQRMFLDGLTVLLREKLSQNQGEASGELYDALSGYLITDISRGRMINLCWNARNPETRVSSIEGEHKIGEDGYMEFHADAQSIRNIVLDNFYQHVD